MSEDPFRCPECNSAQYACTFMEGSVEIFAELSCKECMGYWTVKASGDAFQRHR